MVFGNIGNYRSRGLAAGFAPFVPQAQALSAGGNVYNRTLTAAEKVNRDGL